MITAKQTKQASGFCSIASHHSSVPVEVRLTNSENNYKTPNSTGVQDGEGVKLSVISEKYWRKGTKQEPRYNHQLYAITITIHVTRREGRGGPPGTESRPHSSALRGLMARYPAKSSMYRDFAVISYRVNIAYHILLLSILPTISFTNDKAQHPFSCQCTKIPQTLISVTRFHDPYLDFCRTGTGLCGNTIG